MTRLFSVLALFAQIALDLIDVPRFLRLAPLNALRRVQAFLKFQHSIIRCHTLKVTRQLAERLRNSLLIGSNRADNLVYTLTS